MTLPRTLKSLAKAALITLLVSAGSHAVFALAADPAPQPTPPPLPPANTPVTSDKGIDVQGQAHGPTLLNLGKEKFQIKFVKVRKDYNQEILETPY